jgi:FkbM family methyltransferase
LARLDTFLGRRGLAIVPRADDENDVRRRRLLARLGIDVVLDVGANAGQYGETLRKSGYEGRIVSFEPLDAAFAELSGVVEADPRWEARQLALGAKDGSAQINVAGNSTSSSLLPMGERHLQSAPQSAYVDVQRVETARLDTIWDDVVHDAANVWLKMDVQGFEAQVLRGAEGSIDSIAAVQAELALVPLYDGELGWRELLAYLEERGFMLGGLEPGFSDPETGQLLQFDGIFVREPAVAVSPA